MKSLVQKRHKLLPGYIALVILAEVATILFSNHPF